MTALLLLVPPDQVRNVWPSIRDRIAAIQVACKDEWMPEDVFNDLVGAKAFLWSLADVSGFVIVQLLDYSHGRDLHCWICYNGSGEPPIAYWEQLLEIARECQCKGITFENERPGFQKAIPGLRLRYHYRAEVTPGGDDGHQESNHD